MILKEDVEYLIVENEDTGEVIAKITSDKVEQSEDYAIRIKFKKESKKTYKVISNAGARFNITSMTVDKINNYLQENIDKMDEITIKGNMR